MISAVEENALNQIQRSAEDMDDLRARFRAGDMEERTRIKSLLGPMEVEFADIRMIVDPRDNYTETCIWLDGHPPELKSLVGLVEIVEGRNALVFDIGANCGAFTIPLGLAVGKGSRVVAFEPNPIMVGRLGANVALNQLSDKIRIECCAISDKDGEAVLNFRGHNFGQASLKKVKRRMRNGGVVVPTRPLAAFAGNAKGHDVSVIKIDVEGAEDVALNPLFDAADKGGWLPDAILIEVRHAEEWQTDLCGRILSNGYNVTLRAEGNALYVRKT